MKKTHEPARVNPGEMMNREAWIKRRIATFLSETRPLYAIEKEIKLTDEDIENWRSPCDLLGLQYAKHYRDALESAKISLGLRRY